MSAFKFDVPPKQGVFSTLFQAFRTWPLPLGPRRDKIFWLIYQRPNR
ncbi:MAG: hypothetical protein QOJ42_7858 [Acidobacteriaceae bacterium]|jgi:hypothetical protein|nr:hypothetical protein [Acidobacteriaceae bacterium]